MITLQQLSDRFIYWKYFFELSDIPRPSRHEERACRWVIEKAEKWGLQYKQDDFGNITVWVPANRKELEHLPLIALQGHLDMVCEKDNVPHDFMNDPLTLRVSDDQIWVTATNTTLGADNGIAVAYEMALMDPECECAHGPLELVFTLDEETGLNGAANLGDGMLTASYMINIDNSQEGMCCVGCAGGKDYMAEVPVIRQAVPDNLTPYLLEVKGLAGGHSGSEIYDGRASAIKLVERVLSELVDSIGMVWLSYIEAGDKRNAIPRSAEVRLYMDSSKEQAAKELFSKMQFAMRTEMIELDQAFEISILAAEKKDCDLVLASTSFDLITKLLRLCPHGVVQKRSLVSSGSMLSSNLAAVHFFDDYVLFINNSRFSNSFGGAHMKRMLDSTFKESDAKIYSENGYIAWERVEHSALEQLFCKEYEAHNKSAAYVDTIHGGIECGIIRSLQSHPLDVISIGPEVQFLHAPTERLHIESSDNMWAVIGRMLYNAGELHG